MATEEHSTETPRGSKNGTKKKPTRRDFLYLSAAGFGVVGLAAAIKTLVNMMNPAKDVAALASVEVNVKALKPGEQKIIPWRGKPVFVKRRTEEEIKKVEAVPLKALKDPQTDKDRFGSNQEFLVVVGVCTHLGCIPNQRENLNNAEGGGGWLCACHGSVYDASGRIIQGPAPKNLEVPPYSLMNNNETLKIG